VEELRVKSGEKIALIDITGAVQKALEKIGLRDGLCNLFAPHTTAAVMISENWDRDVTADLLDQLQRLVPDRPDYKHAEGNSQAHILSAMLGVSINIPVRDGRLALGRWQGVMLAEFDGPRERVVRLSAIPSSG
jgi:secondary thiamine-phosphate synthase enzyme